MDHVFVMETQYNGNGEEHEADLLEDYIQVKVLVQPNMGQRTLQLSRVTILQVYVQPISSRGTIDC